MTEQVEKQLNMVMKRQKKIIAETENPTDKAQVYGILAGFLAGMKLTGAITPKEYKQFYDEIANL